MNEEILNDLVRYVNDRKSNYPEWYEKYYLKDDHAFIDACGCMGPRGYMFCSCKMQSMIYEHKVKILNVIDPEMALKIMRQKIIKALQ